MGRAPAMSLKISKGEIIDSRYVVLKKLGEGGCGSVYRCRLTKRPDLDVAVKVLENNTDLPRFRREQKVLGNSKSPYVVKLMGHGAHAGHPYLALEFMEGGSLRDLLNARGKLEVEEAAWLLLQAVRGLKETRTVHRDLKPENLLLNKGQNGRNVPILVNDLRKGVTLKVADFGLAKHRVPGNTNLTNTGQIMGTPLYMSPEQCRNTRDVTIQSDIYSLGILFFEMLVGKPPFEADNAYDVMAMHCNEEITYPKLDAKAQQVIANATKKNPKERYRSLAAFERDLHELAGIGAPPPEPSRLGTWLMLAAAMAVFVFLLWLVHDQLLSLVGDWWNGTGARSSGSHSGH
jgi:serine/threonine-protein kinase